MQIQCIKLVSGDEIMGQAERLSDGRLKISNCVTIRLVASQIQGAEPTMAFVPFPQMIDDNQNSLIIEPLHIVYQYTPYKELITEYNSIFTEQKGTSQLITG